MQKAYPFSAIAGQDEMKLALLVAAIDPGVGGVLVLGDRGTGKSTAARALAGLLPPMTVVKGCAFNCDPAVGCSRPAGCDACGPSGELASELSPVPIVDLPLGATEDRVVGTLDLEAALARGERRFEPGLLARAHRGFLYIDEVNLLEDHLVDLLLDVSASGENVVERDGLSVRHPARIVLVGSGNPEEGELRPQLLDRFGLAVEIRTPSDIKTRMEIVRRRMSFDSDPEAFLASWAESEARTRGQISAARERLPSVITGDDVLERSTHLCLELGTDGLRAELTLNRAARALAALEGASRVEDEHLRRVAPMALRHRLRRNPLDEASAGTRVERTLSEVFGSSGELHVV